ncbi:MAG: hypothetical protein AAGC60_00800 [Acidobacteriota bacterium]
MAHDDRKIRPRDSHDSGDPRADLPAGPEPDRKDDPGTRSLGDLNEGADGSDASP